MNKQVGKMLSALRIQAGISLSQLSRGIIGKSELFRIENGEKEADRVELEALFQRMGKSVDKLEFLVSVTEYLYLKKRQELINAILQSDETEMQRLLVEYESSPEGKKPLHRQYQIWIRSIFLFCVDKQRESAMAALEKGIEITFSEWRKENWEGYYLCTQEIMMLLTLVYGWRQQNRNEKEAELLLQKIYEYIEKNYTDAEERVRVYPACIWLLASEKLREDEILQAQELVEKGINSLTENGIILWMQELLELKEKCLERLSEENILISRQMEAIQYLMQVAEYTLPEENMLHFIMRNQHSEIQLSNELLRDMRKVVNISQINLGEDDYTQTTLSLIERGLRKPNKKKYFKIMEKLGVRRKSYYGFVIAEDYGIYEKVRLYNRTESKFQQEKARELLDEIEQSLDMTIPTNRQFVEMGKLIHRKETEKPDYKELMQQEEQVLRYTMKHYAGEIYRTPSREEVVILNGMAQCMKLLGKVKDAGDLYQKMLDKYDASTVKSSYHFISELLICQNYACVLEVENQLEKSEMMAKRGMCLALNSLRGDIPAKILVNLSCVYDKRPGKQEIAEKHLRHGFYLLGLYGYKKEAEIIKSAYVNIYRRMPEET